MEVDRQCPDPVTPLHHGHVDGERGRAPVGPLDSLARSRLRPAQGSQRTVQVGGVACHLGEEDRRLEEKDPCVPAVLPAANITPRRGEIGLLDEALDLPEPGKTRRRPAALDVAVAGLGPRGLHAERDQCIRLESGASRELHVPREGGRIGNPVVGRQHGHHGTGIGRRHALGGPGRRHGGIATPRFDEHARGGEPRLPARDPSLLLPADDPDPVAGGQAASPGQRRIEQRLLSDHLQEVLGPIPARSGPEAFTSAAGQDDHVQDRIAPGPATTAPAASLGHRPTLT